MRIRYYYFRDMQKRPIITVCLMEEKGIFSRGISVCAKGDNPCKKIGRKIARDRTYKAMFNEATSMEKTKSSDFYLLDIDYTNFEFADYKYLYSYNVNLTAIEKYLYNIS